MVLTTSAKKYVSEKQKFFTHISDGPDLKDFSIIINDLPIKSYADISKHRDFIEQDFNHLFASLQENGQNRDKFWYYAYYCSLMLKDYYKAYGKNGLAEKYLKLSEEINARFEKNKSNTAQSNKDQVDKDTIATRLSAAMADLANTPMHSSQIKNMVGLTNIIRMQVIFARIVLQTSFGVAKQSEWLSKLFGGNAGIDSMLNQLDKPSGVFNGLSVAVFAVRLAMNTGTLLKHTFRPSEKESKLSLKERFSKELSKRHTEMFNDGYWGGVNALTNYAKYFNISAPVANLMLTTFLVVDISMLLYKRRLAEHDYILKKEQYLLEQKMYEGDPEHQEVLAEQLRQLELEWKTTDGTFWFNITAGILLMSSFTAAIMFTVPAAVPCAFFVICLAISMYVSAEMYGKYKKQSLVLADKQEKGEATRLDEVNVEKAQTDFLFAMFKNTALPMVIMGALAISTPAAILLTVAAIAYEVNQNYKKDDVNEPKPEGESPKQPAHS
jgi:hypothetical protein